jgi:ATP-dependent helicase/nuclease subunit B
MSPSRPQVFSIPAGAPFLAVLADALLSERLAAIPYLRDDPLALADVTVLLPTRRAVRSFREVLIGKLGGEAAILPRIRPIGDVDEEDHLLNAPAETGADRLALTPAISRLDRQLALTQLTLAWRKALRREILDLAPHEPLLIPASAADATRLAADLARLIDDMATAGIGWDGLATLVPEDHARHFQITLDFLKIAREAWPAFLVEENRVDPAARRDTLIRAEAARLAASPPRGPVIAAGSTGSIPATAALLNAIARLPNGAVVLPGLDQDLDEAGWNAIGGGEAPSAAAHTHPQFGLKQLIAALGIARTDVERLAEPAPSVKRRSRTLSEALRPSETTDVWASFRAAEGSPDADPALAGVGMIVARNEQEEALAIALALREAVDAPGTTAALVTPDRHLARRVAVELGRWGLAVDDSAGAPLDRLPAGVFARLAVDVLLAEGDPAVLLALLKHPFAAFGMARPECRRAARVLEIALLRGRRVTGGLAALADALAASHDEVEKHFGHVRPPRQRLKSAEWYLAARLVRAVGAAFAPMEARFRSGAEITVAAASELLRDALSKAARDETGRADLLWEGAGGDAVSTLLESLSGSVGQALSILPGEYSAFLGALLGDVAVTRPAGADPRIHVWGALEARLQSVDLLILGGLDEGLWPAATRTDPWLSRAMRAEIGLLPPERRIGLAAHDFAEAATAPRVFVSRAEKREGSPTVASRWLQRLEALVGTEATERMRADGDRYVQLARSFDWVKPGDLKPVDPPAPKPPVAARPRGLSVTEIETLVRDPYAIYARRVLGLEALDPLGAAPDYALRGSLIHEALGAFTAAWTGAFDAAAEAELIATGRRVLAEIADFPDIHAIWSIRFASIARWFVRWEAARSANIEKRNPEISGHVELPLPGGPFRLRGRADRIDLRRDGGLEILDFKTGSPPSATQLLLGLAPQLALEAAMAIRGGFDESFKGRPLAGIAWIGLSKVGRDEPLKSAVERGWTEESITSEVFARFMTLIAAFDGAGHPYISRARPMFETRYESPYDHLARVREWGLQESEEDLEWLWRPPT